MSELINLKVLRLFWLLSLVCLRPFSSQAQEDLIRSQIEKTGEAIRAAFKRGDIPEIARYHHPEVIKALSYTNHLIGREALIKDLENTLGNFSLEFLENTVEHLLIQGDVVVEQTLFAIKGTPKSGGESFVFKGRTQVTYVRYQKSPTGWASIREIIQVASE